MYLAIGLTLVIATNNYGYNFTYHCRASANQPGPTFSSFFPTQQIEYLFAKEAKSNQQDSVTLCLKSNVSLPKP